jgi:protocatechuate 3,4-dioxygenase, alpha subunit
MTLKATSSQTVGPFFRIGLSWLYTGNIAPEGVSGERFEISGKILDADGNPVPDAILELWQANAHGKYAHPEDTQDQPLDPKFQGFGRISAEEAAFRFTTIKPGRVPGSDGKLQAPHIVVSIFMRGLLRRLVTRIYFPDDPANPEDLVLNLVEPSRRHTLIAQKSSDNPSQLVWNVHVQGPNETVFFDF